MNYLNYTFCNRKDSKISEMTSSRFRSGAYS